MQKLYEVAEQEGVMVEEYAPLPAGFYGLYYNEENHFPVVSLSREIYGNRKLERSILAEELGHYLTTTDHCLPRFFKNFWRERWWRLSIKNNHCGKEFLAELFFYFV